MSFNIVNGNFQLTASAVAYDDAFSARNQPVRHLFSPNFATEVSTVDGKPRKISKPRYWLRNFNSVYNNNIECIRCDMLAFLLITPPTYANTLEKEKRLVFRENHTTLPRIFLMFLDGKRLVCFYLNTQRIPSCILPTTDVLACILQ